MTVQKQKIEVEKWFEGERRREDPGMDYVLDWIIENGSWFRQAWEKSCCRQCLSVTECGHEVKEFCDIFKKK